MVYVLQAGKEGAAPKLEQVRIRTGIDDGVSTEVIEGLDEGQQVVTGMVITEAEMRRPANNPFSGRRRF